MPQKMIFPILIGLFGFSLMCTPVLAQSQTHTVRAGESLSGIAKQYGISLSTLINYNNIGNPDLIKPGQVLRIPGVSGNPTPSPTSDQRMAPVEPKPDSPRLAPLITPTPKPWIPTATPPTIIYPVPLRLGEIKHIVRSGDTLYSLSVRFGISIWTIRNRNNMRDNTLIVGQALAIPVTSIQAASPTPKPTSSLPTSTATATARATATATLAPTQTLPPPTIGPRLARAVPTPTEVGFLCRVGFFCD